MSSNTRTAIAWISAAAIIYILATHTLISTGQDNQPCDSQVDCNGNGGVFDYCDYTNCR